MIISGVKFTHENQNLRDNQILIKYDQNDLPILFLKFWLPLNCAQNHVFWDTPYLDLYHDITQKLNKKLWDV